MTPDEFTNETLMLNVGDGHQLWVHDWGNKDSKNPIIFLHGGPGGSSSNGQKQSFNPKKDRVVFFDQRGCGQSIPLGSLESNTTEDLVDDITKIADHLGLDSFVLTGGSWGSCLALVYGVRNPARVQQMVLRGIFTGTQPEIDWITKGGYETFFPDVLEKFIENTPEEHKGEAGSYHLENILSNDLVISAKSGMTMMTVEGSLMSLDDRYTPIDPEKYEPSFMRLESHYMANKCFLEDNYIQNNIDKLTMPIWLVQGRYDMVCPPKTAWDLHKKLSNSKLTWTLAGHGNERSTYDVYSTIFASLGDN